MHAGWFGFAVALFATGVCGCGLDDSVVTPFAPGSDGGRGNDAASPVDASNNVDAGPATELIYANSQSDLYSFDLLTNTLTHLGAFNNCGVATNSNDIAIDGTGQLYLLQKNDAIYALGRDGSCSARSVLLGDEQPGIDKIAARAAGTPSIIAADMVTLDLFTIDPASGALTDVTVGDFPGDGLSDLACSQSGRCFSAFDRKLCFAGKTSSCLYTFPADGSSPATPLGAIGVQPAGLAYANNVLYSFNADGSVAKIPLTGIPTAAIVKVVLAAGTTAPSAWFGAASSSNYP